MLPARQRGVVVCGTRRAEQWRDAFVDAGIEAAVVETTGDEAEAGACKVIVPEAQVVRAHAIVTEVLAGRRRLPGPRLGRQAIVALIAILGMVVWMLAR